MNVVIFTKDRPAQLDACLRSLHKHALSEVGLDTKILYVATPDASSDKYEEGYGLIRKAIHHKLTGPAELRRQSRNFKQDLLDMVNPDHPLTMFLVDDIIFKKDFSLSDPEVSMVLNNEHLIALSLRLDKNISHCYALNNQPAPLPNFVKGNVWKWRGCSGDWGYPYSVDGNIYRTSDILRRMRALPYSNPNQFESVLNSESELGKPEYLACYVNESKLVNIPANRVQDEFKNRHANLMSAEEINNRFLGGERISLDTVAGQNNTTVHAEIPYIWEKSPISKEE